jgi:cation:H+ antiporter
MNNDHSLINENLLEIPDITEDTTLSEKKELDFYYMDYIMATVGLVTIGVCALIGFEQNAQNTVFNIVLIIASLALLLGASDIVLEFAVKLSSSLGVSEMVIGLTVVSLGTSIPEMFTAIAAANEEIGAFVVGDIYGSYITQLTLFLGICILFDPKSVSKKYVPHIKRDGILVICAILFLSFNISDGKLLKYEGYLGIGLYIAYMLFLYIKAKKNPEVAREEIEIEEKMTQLERVFSKQDMADKQISKVPTISDATPVEKELAIVLKEVIKPSVLKKILYTFGIFMGTFACYIGAKYVVLSGSNLAYSMHVSPHVVAATIVGFGTGFPEFAVSVMAIRRKNLDIAYGNLLGSNIVDPCVSISLGILTKEIFMTASEVGHILTRLLTIAIIIDIFIVFSFSRKEGTRKHGLFTGLILILSYVLFLISSFIFE